MTHILADDDGYNDGACDDQEPHDHCNGYDENYAGIILFPAAFCERKGKTKGKRKGKEGLRAEEDAHVRAWTLRAHMRNAAVAFAARVS